VIEAASDQGVGTAIKMIFPLSQKKDRGEK
jgi:hypothetical protein